MTDDSTMDEALRRLLPESISVFCSQFPEEAGPLLPGELEASASMAKNRLRTYRHGRYCARQALNSLGFGQPPIPTGSSREPVWPRGVVGSISHCGDVAAAAVGRAADFDGIGIDIEAVGGMEPGSVELIATFSERRVLDQPLKEHGYRLLFTIKESIYKCIWPRLRRYVDFQEVQVQLEPRTRQFRAEATDAEDSTLVRELAYLSGSYDRLGALLVATAIAASGSAG